MGAPGEAPVNEDLRRGLGWSFAGQCGRHAIVMGGNVVLAHLLAPREFGLMAMAAVVTGFAAILAELGLSPAIVQGRLPEERLSGLFWLNAACGLAAGAAVALAAPWVARQYGEPVVAPLLAVLAAGTFFGALGVVPAAVLWSRMDFRGVGLAELSSAGAGTAAAIALAGLGGGVWSLAGRVVVGAAAGATAAWFLSGWRPRPAWRWDEIRGPLRFGATFGADSALNYWTRTLDNLLVGWLLGAYALGLYAAAYWFLILPLAGVSWIAGRVLLPALARIQEDKDRVKAVFLRVNRGVALVSFPAMLGVCATARETVLVLLGGAWLEAVPLVRVFALVGMAQSAVTLIGNLYTTQNRPDLQLKVGLGLRWVPLLGIVAGLRWGALGVALGYAGGWAATVYPSIVFPGRLVGLSFREFARSLGPSLACAAGSAAAAAAMGALLGESLGVRGVLGAQWAAGLGVYALLLPRWEPEGWRDLREAMAV